MEYCESGPGYFKYILVLLTLFYTKLADWPRQRLFAPLDKNTRDLRPNSWTKPRQKSWEFSTLQFTVTSTAFRWYVFFFKLTQPLTVSNSASLYTAQEKGGKPDRKAHPFPYGGLRNPYRNLKSENSQDYAQKPQRNCTFMNSASGHDCCYLKFWRR